MIKNKYINNISSTRHSDQKKYYIEYLKKQRRAERNKFSILGRHHENLNNFVRQALNTLPAGSRILDAGCGLSGWTTFNLREKYNISGVDGEPEAIEFCKKIYKRQDYRVGNLYNLTSYKKNYYDAIVMREVIEHFITPERAVKEIFRILKPNGLCIITTPNYNNLFTHIIEHTYSRIFGGACKPYKDEVHPSKFTPHSLKLLLEKYFVIEKLEIIDYGISQICIARKSR